MSKKIECRLPDQLYIDLKTRCSAEGITVTDAVISNITDWLYNGKSVCHDKPECGKIRGFNKIAECHDKPAAEIVQSSASGEAEKTDKAPEMADKPIITPGSNISAVIKRAVKRPDYLRPAHHPQCTCAVCKAHKSSGFTA